MALGALALLRDPGRRRIGRRRKTLAGASRTGIPIDD